MHLYAASIFIDDIIMICTEQLGGRLEFIFNHIKSINENSNATHNLINQIRADLHRRIDLRNKYDHQKLPLLLHVLCQITSEKKHFQFIERQHSYSKQFFNKIFNIQSFIDIDQFHPQYDQSIKCREQLRSAVEQYENDLVRLKQKVAEQNEQIHVYSTNLCQIQFDQNQILSDIQQLKQQILFEKRLHTEIKSTLTSTDIDQESTPHHDLLNQIHTEYIDLTSRITQIKLNIEQKSIGLLPLQLELYVYHTILNVNDIHSLKSKDQPLLLPTITANTQQIHRQSAAIIGKLKEEMLQPKLQLLPIESISTSECIKIKSRKSKENFNYSSVAIRADNEMSIQLIENMLPF